MKQTERELRFNPTMTTKVFYIPMVLIIIVQNIVSVCFYEHQQIKIKEQEYKKVYEEPIVCNIGDANLFKALGDELLYVSTVQNEDKDNTKKEEAKPKFTVHTVEKGESFWSICKTYYGNSDKYIALRDYNGYTENQSLHVGDNIKIPTDQNDLPKVVVKTENVKSEKPKLKVNYSKKYKYGVKTKPAVQINIPTNGSMKNFTGKVDTSTYKLLGYYSTTGYDPKCSHCCGSTKGIGAAGVQITPGYSVAAPSNIPLGTTLYVEGYGYYVVEDRGAFKSNNIDIACSNHDTCATVTNIPKNVKVYIVSNN